MDYIKLFDFILNKIHASNFVCKKIEIDRKNNDKEADKPSIPSTRLIEFIITMNTNREKHTDS